MIIDDCSPFNKIKVFRPILTFYEVHHTMLNTLFAGSIFSDTSVTLLCNFDPTHNVRASMSQLFLNHGALLWRFYCLHYSQFLNKAVHH